MLTGLQVDDAASMADGWKVSLLNPANRHEAMDALWNILLCCAGGGQMTPTITRRLRDETLELLRTRHASPAPAVERVRRFIDDATADAPGGAASAGESACDVCAIRARVLVG